ncbi:MAG TPA: hypothetical protein VGI73_11190 [Solirubrobacterales bacterium]|jgi:hypothetical protein
MLRRFAVLIVLSMAPALVPVSAQAHLPPGFIGISLQAQLRLLRLGRATPGPAVTRGSCRGRISANNWPPSGKE